MSGNLFDVTVHAFLAAGGLSLFDAFGGQFLCGLRDILLILNWPLL